MLPRKTKVNSQLTIKEEFGIIEYCTINWGCKKALFKKKKAHDMGEKKHIVFLYIIAATMK